MQNIFQHFQDFIQNHHNLELSYYETHSNIPKSSHYAHIPENISEKDAAKKFRANRRCKIQTMQQVQ